MQQVDALTTWLSLMTPRELDDLAASYDWSGVHLDWSARPKIAIFLDTLDGLIVSERQRRPVAVESAAWAVAAALSALDRGDLQYLLRSYLRLARNRERDASEPIQRFHAAVGDLLTRELESRLR
jgi:hypothetical protein